MNGLFTVDDSKSFFSPKEILPIAQENKYNVFFDILGKVSYLIPHHEADG